MTRDIEYMGDPPLLDDMTQLRIQLGEVPSSAADVLRRVQATLQKAIPGITKRVVDPEWFGTSRQYVFGPGDPRRPERAFVTAVDERDVDKILGSSSGHEFRLVGEEGIRIIQPPSNIVLVNEIEGGMADVFA